jgi:hypothetical protein
MTMAHRQRKPQTTAVRREIKAWGKRLRDHYGIRSLKKRRARIAAMGLYDRLAEAAKADYIACHRESEPKPRNRRRSKEEIMSARAQAAAHAAQVARARRAAQCQRLTYEDRCVNLAKARAAKAAKHQNLH